MRFHLVLVAGWAIVLTTGFRASAGIVGTSGQMVAIATPPDVRFDALESDTFIRVFPERQDVALASQVQVDISLPGTVPTSAINLTPGFISAGMRVTPFFVTRDRY